MECTIWHARAADSRPYGLGAGSRSDLGIAPYGLSAGPRDVEDAVPYGLVQRCALKTEF